MIRNAFLAILAIAVLGGCMTDGYSYRGGRGDYYYGQPTIEYRHYGYGVPYGSLGYGYYDYYGYPYGYYDYPYGYYDRDYYYVPPPQDPPAQPPQQDPDRSDYSAKHWAEQHGYPLGSPARGINDAGNAVDANRHQMQVAVPGSHMRASSPSRPALRAGAPSNPPARAHTPSQPTRSMLRPSRPATPVVVPSRPQSLPRQVSPSRALPKRPSSMRSSSGSRGDDEDMRVRRP